MSRTHDVATKYGNGKKTLPSYILGLGLSLIFTFIAFALVSKHLVSTQTTYILLGILAVFQLIAQIVFFLRMNTTKEGQWNLMPFLFALVIVGVLVLGSFWIMYNLNYNMVH